MGVDLVLSSGFLAFAEQAGFLAAIEDLGVAVDGVCGTSSGALAGSLWAAGMPAEAVFAELCSVAPLRWVRVSRRPWRGLLSMEPALQRLRQELPARFDALPLTFAVGLARAGVGHLRSEGALPEAVVASCAIPRVFLPVALDGEEFVDGGSVDRTFLSEWRSRRGLRPTIVHLLQPSYGPDGVALRREVVVRSPRSGAQLWSLGDARSRFDASRSRAREALRHALRDGGELSV